MRIEHRGLHTRYPVVIGWHELEIRRDARSRGLGSSCCVNGAGREWPEYNTYLPTLLTVALDGVECSGQASIRSPLTEEEQPGMGWGKRRRGGEAGADALL